MTNEWVKCGERLWQQRVLTYGTKPLPLDLPIYNSFVTPGILRCATKELADRRVPVRFLTADDAYNEDCACPCKAIIPRSSWDNMNGNNAKVRCRFLRAPTWHEVHTALGLPVDENLLPVARVTLTEWEVHALPGEFEDCRGRKKKFFPIHEIEFLVDTHGSDGDLLSADNLLSAAMSRPAEVIITYEGNKFPPYKLSIPSKVVLQDQYGPLSRCRWADNCCVRYHDAQGRPLRVDIGHPRNLFKFRQLEREEYPAGMHCMQLVL